MLKTERDFFDLAWAYLKKASAQGVRHAELFFDPQTHTKRGVAMGAVGLDSSEKGHPPRKFERIFFRARAEGLRCAEDSALVERLARERVPLTMCPMSNVKLKVFSDLRRHNLKDLLERGYNEGGGAP